MEHVRHLLRVQYLELKYLFITRHMATRLHNIVHYYKNSSLLYYRDPRTVLTTAVVATMLLPLSM